MSQGVADDGLFSSHPDHSIEQDLLTSIDLKIKTTSYLGNLKMQILCFENQTGFFSI